MAPKDAPAEPVDPKLETAREKSQSADAQPSSRARLRRNIAIGLVALLGPLVAVMVGGYIYLTGGRYIVTDNAYVKAEKVAVSADITGRVAAVEVGENDIVKPGQILFRVDPAPLEIALARADAMLSSARQGVAALRAAYQQKVAAIARARGEIEFHEQQLARQRKLSRRNLVSGLNLDTAIRNLRDSKDAAKVAEQERVEALAKLGGDLTIEINAHPTVQEAKAARDKALFDLERSSVRAAITGAITNFDLQAGEYVRAGMPVFSLVGTHNVWVHANYKETELTYVRVGQSATISVDTYPGEVFEAIVDGIAPATGAEFAVLPPQNATGNWVKVVQRLTVRLRLMGPAEGKVREKQLRAGMSAHVEIDTKHKRELTGLLGLLTNWTVARPSRDAP